MNNSKISKEKIQKMLNSWYGGIQAAPELVDLLEDAMGIFVLWKGTFCFNSPIGGDATRIFCLLLIKQIGDRYSKKNILGGKYAIVTKSSNTVMYPVEYRWARGKLVISLTEKTREGKTLRHQIKSKKKNKIISLPWR